MANKAVKLESGIPKKKEEPRQAQKSLVGSYTPSQLKAQAQEPKTITVVQSRYGDALNKSDKPKSLVGGVYTPSALQKAAQESRSVKMIQSQTPQDIENRKQERDSQYKAFAEELTNQREEKQKRLDDLQNGLSGKKAQADLIRGYITDARYSPEEQQEFVRRSALLDEDWKKDEAEIEALKKEIQRLGSAQGETQDTLSYYNILSNGDQAAFARLYELETAEKNQQYLERSDVEKNPLGQLVEGIKDLFSGKDDPKAAEKSRIWEELQNKGYDVSAAYQAYKNYVNAENRDQRMQKAQDWVNEHPILNGAVATAARAVTGPIRGMVALEGGAFDGFAKNSPTYALNDIANASTSQITENIQNAVTQRTGSEKAGKAIAMIYSGVSSMAESFVTMSMPLGEVLMGLNAATETYQNSLSNGMSQGQAFAHGLAAGVFETLFEHFSLEKLHDFISSDKRGFLHSAWELFQQFIYEGSEEVLTDIANEAYDYLANGGLSEYERFVTQYLRDHPEKSEADAKKAYSRQFGAQLLESGVVGGIAGFGHGVIATGIHAASDAGAAIRYGRGVQGMTELTGQTAKEVVSPVAQRLDESGRTYRRLDKAAGKMDAGRQAVNANQQEKTEAQEESRVLDAKEESPAKAEAAQKKSLKERISDFHKQYATGRAVNKAFNEIQAADQEAIKQALKEHGYHDRNAERTAREIRQMFTNELEEAKKLRLLEKRGVQDVIDNVINNPNSDVNQRDFLVLQLREALNIASMEHATAAQKNEALGVMQAVTGLSRWELINSYSDEQIEKLRTQAPQAIREDAGKSLVKSGFPAEFNGHKITTGAVAGIQDGELVLTIDRETGATAKLSEIDFSNQKSDAGQEVFSTLSEMMQGKGDFRVRLSAEGANVALALLEEMPVLDYNGFIADFYKIYSAGKSGMRQSSILRTYSAIDRKLGGEAVKLAYETGAREYEVREGVTRIGDRKLNQSQLNQLTALDEFFRAHHRRVIVVDALYSGEGKMIADLYGEQNADIIVISLYEGELWGRLGKDYRENLLSVGAFHELFHQLKESGPEGKMMVEHLINIAKENLSKRENGEALMKEIREERKGYAEEDIDEEIAAQYFATMKTRQQIEDVVKGNRSIWEKVIDKLKEIVNELKQKIEALSKRDLVVKAAMEAETEEMELAIQAFDFALEVSDYERAQKGENKKAAEEGGEKYSFVLSKNGLANDDLLYYDDYLKEVIAKHGDVILDSYSKLASFVHAAYIQKDRKQFGYFGIISEDIVRNIEKSIENPPTGYPYVLDVKKNYSISVNLDDIRHLRDERGFREEEMVELLDRLPDTIINFDRVHFHPYEAHGHNEKGLLFEKTIENGEIISYNLISKKHRRLSLQTMYKHEKRSLSTDAVDNTTAHVQNDRDQTSKNIITDSSEKSNTQNKTNQSRVLNAETQAKSSARKNQSGFEKDKYYDRQIDKITSLQDGTRVKVGEVKEESALHRVGFPSAGMWFDVGKIRKELSSHEDHLTTTILKQIPEMLNDPIAIAEYRGPKGDIENTATVYGIVLPDGKTPVAVGIMMVKARNGDLLINKIRTVHARTNARITDDNILYLNEDKKRTRQWFQVCGISVPLEGTKFGFIRSIEYIPKKVNTQNKTNQSRVLDAEYIQAVESGDLEAAQRMVDEAAKAAGYDLRLYHGSKKGGGFTVFKDWQYFTANRKYAERYMQRDNEKSLYKVYVKTANIFDTRRPECRDIFEQKRVEYGMSEIQPSGLPDWTDGYDISNFIDENDLSYDGIVLDEGGDMTAEGPVSRGPSYVVRKSSQIKSAESVTYDNNGNVIPLSERFNEKKENIRFSRVLNAEAQEYTDRLKGSSRQLWERIDILQDLAENIYAFDGLQLGEGDIRKIARKYNLSAGNRTHVTELAARIQRAAEHMGATESIDGVLYELYQIAKEEASNVGHWEDMGDAGAKEFRKFIRGQMIYVDEGTLNEIAEGYGGRAALRRATFGKFTLTTDKSKGTSGGIDALYQEALGLNFGLPETTTPSEQVANLLALYKTTDQVWIDDSGDWTGETLDEVATDYAFDMLTDLLTGGRKLSREEQRTVERMEMLKKESREQRAQGIHHFITRADEELNRKLQALNESDKDILTVEREAQELQENYRVQALKRAYEERIKNIQRQYNENIQRQGLIKDVKRNLNALGKLITEEKDTAHVPEELKKSVMRFIMAFDSGDRNVFTENMFLNLQHAYEYISRATDEDGNANALFTRFDEDIAADIKELSESVSMKEQKSGRKTVMTSLLTIEELRKVATIAEHIREIVTEANTMFVNGKKVRYDEISRRLISETANKKRNDIQKMMTDTFGYSFLTDKMLTPIYFFNEKIGGVMKDIFEDFRNGQDEWYQKVKTGRDTLSAIKTKYNYKDWKDKKTHFTFTDALGDTWDTDLSVEEMLQIYATVQREMRNGRESRHILTGGIVLEQEVDKGLKGLVSTVRDLTKGGKKISDLAQMKEAEKRAKNERHPLSWDHIQEINNALTDEQRAYADAVVQFMSSDVAIWGNKASMELYGIRKFTEGYYFPFQSAGNYIYKRLGVMDDTRIKNVSFSKRTVYGANTPLVVSGFTEVAAAHIQEMALYSSMLNPIENLTRIFNFNDKESKQNVKSEISRVYGAGAAEYINSFVTAVNGGLRSDKLDNIWNKGTSTFKRAAVMANLSVVVQQPTSLMRAMAMINPKYFLGKFDPKTLALRGADFEDMMEHSSIAGIKEMGGFDTGLGMSAADWIMDERTTEEKIRDLMGKGAEWADAVTWTNLWNAVKREIHDKHPELTVGSDDFYEAVNQRFRDIVDYTQVYDSTISKSELMRNPGGLTKMVTAFMAEPTLSFNLLTQSGKGRTIGKGAALGAFIANVVLNAMAQSIVGAWRKKDEDKTYTEKYLDTVFGNLFGSRDVLFLDSSLSPLTLIPWVKDLVSIWQGYDVTRSDVQVFGEFVDAVQGFAKPIRDGQVPGSQEFLNLAGAISSFTAVPVKKVMQDVQGLYRTVKNSWIKPVVHNSTETAKKAILDGLGLEKNKAELAYRAVLNKDAETISRLSGVDNKKIEELKKKGYSDEDAVKQATKNAGIAWHNLIKEGLAAYDSRVQQAAEAKFLGEFEDYELLLSQLKADGFENNDVQGAVDTLYDAMTPPEYKESAAKEKTPYVPEDLDAAIDRGDKEGFQHIWSALLNQGSKEKTLTNRIQTLAETKYAETLDRSKAREILTQYLGMSNAEAEANLSFWNYSIRHPTGKLNSTAYGTYFEKVASSGISVEVYERYYTLQKKATGVDADGDGKTDSGSKKEAILKIIDELPISKAQKDVLYMLNGYSENTLYTAPWNLR